MASAIGADFAIDTQERQSALKGRLNRHPEAVKRARSNAEYNQWYEATMYGRMGQVLLEPYQEQVMARMVELQKALRRLELLGLAAQQTGSRTAPADPKAASDPDDGSAAPSGEAAAPRSPTARLTPPTVDSPPAPLPA